MRLGVIMPRMNPDERGVKLERVHVAEEVLEHAGTGDHDEDDEDDRPRLGKSGVLRLRSGVDAAQP